MCLGMNPDQLKPRERCASTSNRNFEGRQGRFGRTHLVSPPWRQRRRSPAISWTCGSSAESHIADDWPEVLLKHGRRISVPLGWEHFSGGKFDPNALFKEGIMFWRARRPHVDQEDEAWLIECWQWLTGLLGPIDGDPPRQLVLPARQFFPATEATGHARAEISLFRSCSRLHGSRRPPLRPRCAGGASEPRQQRCLRDHGNQGSGGHLQRSRQHRARYV